MASENDDDEPIGFFAGPDMWVFWLVLVSLVAVVAAIAWRVIGGVLP